MTEERERRTGSGGTEDNVRDELDEATKRGKPEEDATREAVEEEERTGGHRGGEGNDKGQGGEAHEVGEYLYTPPPAGPDEADDGPGDHGAARRVEELVIAPAAVDDLGQDRHEGEGRDEVGDLVVER